MALMTTSIKSEHRFSPSPPSAYIPLYRMTNPTDIYSDHPVRSHLPSNHKGKMDRSNNFLMPPGFGQRDSSSSRDQKRRRQVILLWFIQLSLTKSLRHSPTNSVSSRDNSGSSSHYDRMSPSPGLEGQEQPCSDHLLRFKSSVQAFPLLDHYGRETSASIAAELGGMFFLAESGLGDEESSKAPATYLTCYRRNLFQVTGSVIISILCAIL